MTEKQLINAIEEKRGGAAYSAWTVGVTDRPEERKSEHKNDDKNVSHWKHWPTDSEKIGRDVEKYFIEKGMAGDEGGGGNASYVYIF